MAPLAALDQDAWLMTLARAPRLRQSITSTDPCVVWLRRSIATAISRL